jgi:hypothetical protein
MAKLLNREEFKNQIQTQLSDSKLNDTLSLHMNSITIPHDSNVLTDLMEIINHPELKNCHYASLLRWIRGTCGELSLRQSIIAANLNKPPSEVEQKATYVELVPRDHEIYQLVLEHSNPVKEYDRRNNSFGDDEGEERFPEVNEDSDGTFEIAVTIDDVESPKLSQSSRLLLDEIKHRRLAASLTVVPRNKHLVHLSLLQLPHFPDDINITQAWNLLNDQCREALTNSGCLEEQDLQYLDVNTLRRLLNEATNMKSFDRAWAILQQNMSSVQELLDELGAASAGDLDCLKDKEYHLMLAEQLAVVPRKKYLVFMGLDSVDGDESIDYTAAWQLLSNKSQQKLIDLGCLDQADLRYVDSKLLQSLIDDANIPEKPGVNYESAWRILQENKATVGPVLDGLGFESVKDFEVLTEGNHKQVASNLKHVDGLKYKIIFGIENEENFEAREGVEYDLAWDLLKERAPEALVRYGCREAGDIRYLTSEIISDIRSGLKVVQSNRLAMLLRLPM